MIRSLFARTALSALLLLAGCSSDGPAVSEYHQREGKGLFEGESDTGSAELAQVWGVILGRPLKDRTTPEEALARVRAQTGLTEAYLVDRGDSEYLVTGRFADPTSEEAQRELMRVRALVVEGVRPYAAAVLLPVSGGGKAEAAAIKAEDEMNLRTVRARVGPEALYTVQVGVYGYQDGRTPPARELEEFRRAAEEAAATLRLAGEDAYFLHGPRNSIVTIGVFGPRDLDASVVPAIESPALRGVQERHPHNLLNGQGIRERLRSTSGGVIERIQPSVIVEIPAR